MESLLSLSFDYLSSSDGVKIKKGLRQLEGLLAQICLSQRSGLSAAERRRSMISMGEYEDQDQDQSPKDLASLVDDPAFREFFKLQEGFEWNGMKLFSRHLFPEEPSFIAIANKIVCAVAIRLISCLERLLGKGSSE